MSRASELTERLRAWEPTPRQRQRLKATGYIGYTLVATLFFIWLLLPRRAISTALTTKLSGTIGHEVSADSVSLDGLSGLTFTNLRIEREPGLTIEIPEQSLNLGLLSWISGKLEVSARSRFGKDQGGEIQLSTSGEALALDLDLAALPLEPFFPDRGPKHLLLEGSLAGKLHYQSPGVAPLTANALRARLLNPNGAEAKLDLTLTDGRLANLSLGGFPSPPLRYDKLQVSATLAQSRITLETFDLKGPDGDLSITGTLALAEPLSRSRLNLRLALTPRGEFAQKYGALLGTQMKRESDGRLSVFLQGPVGAPRAQK